MALVAKLVEYNSVVLSFSLPASEVELRNWFCYGFFVFLLSDRPSSQQIKQINLASL